MNNKENDFDTDSYVTKVATTIVDQVFDLVREDASMHGANVSHALMMSIVRHMIFGLVFNSLSNINIPKNASPEEAEAAVKLSYATMKDDIQNAIADGFEAASQKYGGQYLGYYCKVATAGQPVNVLAI